MSTSKTTGSAESEGVPPPPDPSYLHMVEVWALEVTFDTVYVRWLLNNYLWNYLLHYYTSVTCRAHPLHDLTLPPYSQGDETYQSSQQYGADSS